MDGVCVMATTTLKSSDSELVGRAQRGEAHARDELALRWGRRAYLLALQLLGNSEDAKDVAQESMLRFFAALNRFQAGRPVQPWLYQIVRNQARDLARRRRVRPTEPLESALIEVGREPRSTRPGPEEETQVRQLQSFVWQALEDLSAESREVLVLRDYQDLSYREISEVIGTPIGTVMSRLHAARSKLRTLVARSMKASGEADV